MLRALRVSISVFLFPLAAFAVNDSSQTFTLDGQFFQSGNTNPLLDTAAKVTVQILSDDSKCVLYEEEQIVDTHLTQGRFSIQVGSDTGSAKRTTNDKTHPMSVIFQNISPITGNNATAQVCAGGTYTPLAGHSRYFRITVEPSATHVGETLTPDMVLDSVPSALVAETVQGLDRANILQVNNGGGVALTQTSLEAMFTNPAYANLQKVMTGNFMQINANGAPLPVFASNPSAPTAGEVWYDSVANVMKYYNGTVVKTVSVLGSSVTSITGGTGLTGGTLTSTGTLAVDVGTGANKIVQLTAAGKYPAVDGSLITNIATGITALTGDVTASGSGSVAATIANDAISAAKIASAGGGISRLLITDPTTGSSVGYASCVTAGEVLQWTTSGWACATVSSFLGASGVTAGAYGNGTQVAGVTVDSQGRVTALTNVNINFPVSSVNGKTGGAITLNGSDLGLGTASTQDYGTAANQLLPLNGSAQIPAVDGSLIANINATKLTGRTVSSSAPAAGQVLTWNGVSSAWEPQSVTSGTVTNVTGGSGLLGGSISGAGTLSVDTGTTANKIVQLDSNAKIPSVDGSQVTNINAVRIGTRTISNASPAAGQVVAWNSTTTQWEPMNAAATGVTNVTAGSGLLGGSIGTTGTLSVDVGTAANKIVQLDSNAKIPAVDGSQITNINATRIGTRSVSLATPAAGQVMTWNNTTSVWEPGAVTAAPNDWVNGGNAFGSNATLGTTDYTTVSFLTNNATRMTIDEIGRVAIGTTTSNWNFEVNGGTIGNSNIAASAPNSSYKATIRAINDVNKQVQISMFSSTATPRFGVPGANLSLIYSSGDNTMYETATAGNAYFAMNSNVRMTLLSAGNLGVGTMTPMSILDIYGMGTLQSAMIVPRDTVANRPTSAVGGMIRYASDTNSFEGYVNGNWQTISTSGANSNFTGNVTISGAGTGLTVTNTETIGGNLTVTGAAAFNGGASVSGAALNMNSQNITNVGAGIIGSGAMSVSAGGTNQNLTLSGSGTGNVILNPNVGIGTTSPNGVVHAHNAAGAKSEFIATTGGTGSTTTDGVALGINTGAAWVWNNENTPLEFATNNQERMRIDSSGNVGIGTGTPTVKLHVMNGPIRLDTTSSTGYQIYDGANEKMHLYYDTTNNRVELNSGVTANASLIFANNAGNPRMFIRGSDGFVGIGTTSPGHKLTVEGGSVWIRDSTNDNSILIATSASSSGTTIGVRNNAYLTTKDLNIVANNTLFSGTGNVGIGTTSPVVKLSVVGEVQLGSTSAACSAANAGVMQYSSGVLQVCNGSLWIQLAGAQNVSPAGMTAPFSMNTCPVGWLEASGAAVSRTTYSALFTAVGTQFGAGDGSTTFNLPDLRGEFVRGWDHGRGSDSGRSFGTSQGGSLVMNNGGGIADTRVFSLNSTSLGGMNYDSNPGTVSGFSGNWVQLSSGGSGGWGANSWDANYVGGTRPRNLALIYCVSTSSVTASTVANTGSGTVNTVPVWTSGTGLGNSPIVMSGTNVGIGTSIPAFSSKLQVMGPEVISNSGGTVHGAVSATNGNYLTIEAFDTTNVTKYPVYLAPYGGGVGIGTTSVEQKLSVAGGLNIDQGDVGTGALTINGLTFGHSSGEGITSRRIVGGTQFALSFFTNFTERMTIASGTGNVGIGTTSPQSLLQVNGDARFGCRSGFWPLSDGRICMETTLRSSAAGNPQTAVGVCKTVGPGSRVCTHNDFQQACGARAISGIPTVDPYGGVQPGWYGDHGRAATYNGAAYDGNSDDEYLTWNAVACADNNDGPAYNVGDPAAATINYFRCCY